MTLESKGFLDLILIQPPFFVWYVYSGHNYLDSRILSFLKLSHYIDGGCNG